jgi:glycosyltransferase involved in cell wall biosynthesis
MTAVAPPYLPRDAAGWPPPQGPPALPGLSIVLPCFNEEANVADAIRNAAAAARLTSLRHQIVVVDDGSADATAQVAAGFQDRDSRVRVVVHPRNRGYGDAVRSGIGAAAEPWVLLTDADLQFDLRELVDFLPLAATSDLIVGRRVERGDPPYRRLNAAAWNALVRTMFALPVHDVDCAFKLVRRDLLERFELVSSGAMISTELLVRSLAGGARLSEVDVRHRARVAGEQSGASPRVVIRAFRELAQLRATLRGLSAGAAR